MIYDCFTFFNEFDLLEIRLHELNDVVDYFVLSEATKTFTGKDKPLYFNQNKQRFAKFLPKIKHVIVDPPETTDPWVREKFQRDQMFNVLKCQNNDIIMLSDVDEIISAEAVKQYEPEMGIRVLIMKMYYYFLNCKFDQPWPYAKIFPFKEICAEKGFPLSEFRTERLEENCGAIYNAGWHFSFLGNVEDILLKINSFSEQQYNTIYNKNNIQSAINCGKDIFDRKMNFEFVEMDNTYPKFIMENIDRFKKFIFTPETIDVVIPTLGGGELLDTSITFLKNSKNVKTNIIVVDSCTDNLELEDAKVIKSIPYSFAKANNLGAAEGNAEYIVFINNDVFVDPYCLKEMLSLLKSDESIGIVGCKTRLTNHTIQHFGHVFDMNKKSQHFCLGMPLSTPETMCNKEFQSITHACCMIRRIDFEKLYYDESFILGDTEDTEFNFRMRFELGKKCVVGYKCTALHLVSVTRDKFLDEKPLAFEHNYNGIFLPKWGDKIVVDDY